MTILVKFPKGTFNTTNMLDYNFNHYYDMAEDGATHYVSNKTTNFLFTIISIIMFLICFICPILLVIYGVSKASNGNYDFGTTGNKVPKDVPMFRDIPCMGNIFRAYFIAQKYNLMKKKTDFLGALLLKWLKENKIRIEKETVGALFKKEDTCIILNKESTFENNLEQDLHSMFYQASKDGILQRKEFEKWCSGHYSRILNWFDTVLDYERDILISEGKISKEEYKKFGFKNYKYVVDESIMDEAKELKGLKNFLDEFTLIDKREAIEVALFEDYLIFAQILGISKKVASQFKKLYPEIIEQYNYDYDDIFLLYTISDSGITKANSAKARAESYSSGGGGFSSGGGRRWLFWWPVEVGGGFR
ncbi:MAG: DUF2207 domain-containing protein [Clostridia bacterium]|nr:DUF2207 domain-containing protein [Clostridia bacterium]